MEKVYLIVLEYHNNEDYENEVEIKATSEFNNAKKILKEWVEEEESNSWMGNYKKEELDEYKFINTYFSACLGDYSTSIYIKTVDILDE